jgi:hypothetical protein
MGARAFASNFLAPDFPSWLFSGRRAELQAFRIGMSCSDLWFTPDSRAAYQDFLTLWKDADPDIPILKQAKAEYAKLQ